MSTLTSFAYYIGAIALFATLIVLLGFTITNLIDKTKGLRLLVVVLMNMLFMTVLVALLYHTVYGRLPFVLLISYAVITIGGIFYTKVILAD